MRYLAIAILALSGTVNAAALPQSMGSDTRIKTAVYNPYDVYVMNFTVGNVSRVIFEQGENITSVYSGFNDGFEFTPNGNMLIIKALTFQGVQPNGRDWNTNLLVTTEKRNYEFDLRITDLKDPQATYRLDFQYPAEAKQYRLARHVQQLKANEERVQEQRKESLVRYNTDYDYIPYHNSESIIPEMVYNDGKFTYIKFVKNSDLPTVLSVDENDNESFSEVHVSQDDVSTLVVRQLSPAFILRMNGKAVKIIKGN